MILEQFWLLAWNCWDWDTVHWIAGALPSFGHLTKAGFHDCDAVVQSVPTWPNCVWIESHTQSYRNGWDGGLQFVLICDQGKIPVKSNQSECNPSSFAILWSDRPGSDYDRWSCHGIGSNWVAIVTIVGLTIILKKIWPLVLNCGDSDAG